MWNALNNSTPSQMRNNLADLAMSHQVGNSTDWALNAVKMPNDPRISNSIFPADTPKCNLFVSDQLHAAGINPPLTSGDQWPITAQMWTGDVRCFNKVTTQQRGDVVSNGTHVGIAVNETSTVAAGKNKVYMGKDIAGGTVQRFDSTDPTCVVKK